MDGIHRRIDFLKTALRDPDVGAVTMSSKYVINGVLKRIRVPANVVIELGPGEGILTKFLLRNLPPEGKLLAIEPNAAFVKTLAGIDDSRIRIIQGKAQDIIQNAAHYGFANADLAVASIPFSLLNGVDRNKIIQDIHSALAPEGVLIVFNQYNPIMYLPLKKMFRTVSLSYELRNIFPCFIMEAKK